MKTTCGICGLAYDDAAASTVCPHDALAPAAVLARKDLAWTLLGRDVTIPEDRRTARRVHGIRWDGRVLVEGITAPVDPAACQVV